MSHLKEEKEVLDTMNMNHSKEDNNLPGIKSKSDWREDDSLDDTPSSKCHFGNLNNLLGSLIQNKYNKIRAILPTQKLVEYEG